MDEVHTNRSELTADLKSADSGNTAASLHKIYRRGDKIYYANDENVTMIKDSNDKNKVDDPSDNEVDQVLSGESLYKTFSFDNTLNKEETEKCISFWRSVVEKNLEPLKCTIIESFNKSKFETNDAKKTSKEKGKIQNKKLEKSPLKEPKREQTNVWFNILEELQKRRLDKTKLLLKKRCRLCEYTTAPPYETDDFKKEVRNHIQELDQWQPKSTKLSRILGNKSPKNSSVLSSGSKGKSSLSHGNKRMSYDRRSINSENNDIKENVDEALEEIPSDIKTDLFTPLLSRVKEESSKIKYIDAIEKKKREQIYSKWRHNKVEKPCKCFRIECDCNTNPAVIAVTNNTSSIQDCTAETNCKENNQASVHEDDHLNTSSTTNRQDEKHKSEGFNTEDGYSTGSYHFEIDPSSTNQDSATDNDSMSDMGGSYTEKYFSLTNEPRRSILKMKSDRSKNQKTVLKKSLTVMLQCICSSKDCDCGNVIETVHKEILSAQDLRIPEAPKPSTHSLRKVNSLEVIKRRLSSARPSRTNNIS